MRPTVPTALTPPHHDDRRLIEEQARELVDAPDRLYDLLHALIEDCYRRSELPNVHVTRGLSWRRLGMVLTIAETIVKHM